MSQTLIIPIQDAEPLILTLPGTDPTPSPEEIAAKQAARITELEAELTKVRLKSNVKPVTLADGETLTQKQAASEIDRELVETNLRIMQRAREDEALGRTNIPAHQQRPVLTVDSAEKLMGLSTWKALSYQQKAQALDVRPADVDKLDPAAYFGSKSSSSKAVQLNRENPALYRLVKARAVAEGIA